MLSGCKVENVKFDPFLLKRLPDFRTKNKNNGTGYYK